MKTPKITLYGFVPFDRSGKVAWALEELGLPYEFVALDYKKNENKSPAHLARNPMGAVPVLQMDDLMLCESNGICHFLAERFPNANLIPDLGTQEHSACLQWLHFSDGTLGRAGAARLPGNLPDYPAELKIADGKSAQDFFTTLKNETETEFQLSLHALDIQLKNRPYLCERFCVADIAIAYSLNWIDSRGDLKGFPMLKEYLERNKARPAAIKAKVFDWKQA